MNDAPALFVRTDGDATASLLSAESEYRERLMLRISVPMLESHCTPKVSSLLIPRFGHVDHFLKWLCRRIREVVNMFTADLAA
jgi:hypothetical protein